MPVAVTACVFVLLVLLPLKGVALPLNMTPADLWAGLTFPLCWVVLTRQSRPIRLPYLPAILLILSATLMASLLSADPGAGLVTAVQDTYLYAWLVTLAAVFAALDPRSHRALLWAWCAGATVHAVLLIAQFVHQPLIATTQHALGLAITEYELERPSGLTQNSNTAAMFQVLALVPLVLLKPRAAILAPLAALGVAGILATGSMGALVSLVAGAATGMALVLLFAGDRRSVARLAARSAAVVIASAAALALLLQAGAELGEHVESTTWARRDRSAAGRYEIWRRGGDMLMAEVPLWGIGPDRFRQIEGSELHNDGLGFAVERGLFGLAGLCLLVALASARSIELFRVERAAGRLRAAVFPAALAASIAASLTHEVFHTREIWLLLALQEAALWRARLPLASASESESRVTPKSWTAAWPVQRS
jgi:hypothetical protein